MSTNGEMLLKSLTIDGLADLIDDSKSVFDCTKCSASPVNGTCKKKSCKPYIKEYLNRDSRL